MSKKPVTTKAGAERVVKDLRRATRKIHNAEEKIRIVLAGLRGEDGAWSRHRFEWPRDDCRAVPSRRDRPKPVLQLVEGIPR